MKGSDLPKHSRTDHQSIARFAFCLSFVYLSWTVWCLLMAHIGAPFDLPVPRALFRFTAFVVPVIVYLRASKPKEFREFGLTTHWRSGLTVGIMVSGIWAILHASQDFKIPITVHSWMNVIVLSPIAEEILFRWFVIVRLRSWVSAPWAIGISAILFSLVHLPWWWIAGEKSAGEIAQLMGIMFVYGVVFGALFDRTRSILASLLPHSMNNLIAESLVH